MKKYTKIFFLILLLFFLAVFLGYIFGGGFSNFTATVSWIQSGAGLIYWTSVVFFSFVFSVLIYFMLRMKKKSMEKKGEVLEDERMFEPFYGAGITDRIRVIAAVALLGSLPLIIIFLVSVELPDPWITLIRIGFTILLLLLVTLYAVILFKKSRDFYNRFELIVIPAGFFISIVLAISYAFTFVNFDLPEQINYGNIALVFYSLIAILGGVKLLLMANRTIFDKKAKAEEEIYFASEIQQQFLNDRAINTAFIEGYGISKAARQVGGDFIYLNEAKSGSVVAAAGDVSGHSFGAGLIMSMLITRIESHLFYKNSADGLFEILNQSLLNQPRRNIFATAACISIQNKKAILWNAGHMPLLISNADSDELFEYRHRGLALGMASSAKYNKMEIDLNSGDLLVLYSDGLVETRNRNGRVRDEKHFKSVVQSVLGQTQDCESAAKKIIKETLQADYNDHPEDDVTVIVLKIK